MYCILVRHIATSCVLNSYITLQISTRNTFLPQFIFILLFLPIMHLCVVNSLKTSATWKQSANCRLTNWCSTEIPCATTSRKRRRMSGNVWLIEAEGRVHLPPANEARARDVWTRRQQGSEVVEPCFSPNHYLYSWIAFKYLNSFKKLMPHDKRWPRFLSEILYKS